MYFMFITETPDCILIAKVENCEDQKENTCNKCADGFSLGTQYFISQ
jgi:hypothetical protein